MSVKKHLETGRAAAACPSKDANCLRDC